MSVEVVLSGRDGSVEYGPYPEIELRGPLLLAGPNAEHTLAIYSPESMVWLPMDAGDTRRFSRVSITQV